MPTINKSSAVRKSPKGLSFIPINKNILSYPLARHGNARLEWIDNTRRKTTACVVTPDVSLELPIDCGIKRHLTGFDMVALLTLVAMARRKGYKFKASNRQIIAAMSVPDTKFNQRRLRDALNLLGHVTLRYRYWYWPAGTRTAEHRAGSSIKARSASEAFKVMTLVGAGRSREIHMDPDWVEASSKFFFPVKPPLPTQPHALNLLMLLVSKGMSKDGPDERGRDVKRFRSDRWLTRRMGMNHRDRSAGLAAACAALKKWFRDHDCRLRWTEWKSGSEFRYKLPSTVPEEKRRRSASEDMIDDGQPDLGSDFVTGFQGRWHGGEVREDSNVFEDEFADY